MWPVFKHRRSARGAFQLQVVPWPEFAAGRSGRRVLRPPACEPRLATLLYAAVLPLEVGGAIGVLSGSGEQVAHTMAPVDQDGEEEEERRAARPAFDTDHMESHRSDSARGLRCSQP